MKNFRKLSQDVVKVNQVIKTPKGAKPAVPPKNVDASKKPAAQYILKKSRPCCDFYNLRLNLIQNQKNSLDSTATFSVETTQELLICFLWILKNMDRELLFKIMKKWSYVKLKKLLVLFDLCINHFEYRSTIWSDFTAYNQQHQQSETPKSVPIIKTPGSSGSGSASNATSQKNQQKLKQFSAQSSEVRRSEHRSDYTFFKRAKYFKGSESGTDLLFYDLNDCVSSLKKNTVGSNGSRTGQDSDEILSNNDKTALEGKYLVFQDT